MLKNVLTDELGERVNAASTKLELEEIYQPYRPRRRSVAARAKLAGLEPIAHAVLAGQNPAAALEGYVPPETLTDEKAKRLRLILAILINKSMAFRRLFWMNGRQR
nr:Tex-like N-terminal domain-containing protein [Moraxella catarrhalis]